MAGGTEFGDVNRAPENGPPLTAGAVGANYPELLNRVPAIIYIADTGDAGRWHYVSPQIKAILGFSAEEWRADPTLWSQRLHADDRERIIRDETAAAAGTADPGASEYRLRHRDGRAVWIRDDALLVHDADGMMRWHGVMSDVTERKRAEVELERRAAQRSAVARLGDMPSRAPRLRSSCRRRRPVRPRSSRRREPLSWSFCPRRSASCCAAVSAGRRR